MARVDRIPTYIPIIVLEDGGQRTSMELKAWVADEAPAIWEVRRILIMLMPRRGGFKVGAVLRRDLAPFREQLALIGFDPEQHIAPSTRAVRHGFNRSDSNVRDDAIADDIKDEWSCSTPALLLLLLWWTVNRKMVREKKLGASILVAFIKSLAAAAALTEIVDIDISYIEADARALCAMEPVSADWCCHTSSYATALKPSAHGCIWGFTVAALHKMFGLALQCKAMELALQRIVRRIAVAVDSGIIRGDWNHDPLRADAILRGVKRNLRIDEDYKRAALRASSSGRASSSRVLMRALGDVDPSLCLYWSKAELSSVVVCGWMTFSNIRTLCIAPDASRFGNPAEDTLAIPIYSPDCDFGHWCPLQVCLGGSGAGHVRGYSAPKLCGPAYGFLGNGLAGEASKCDSHARQA